MKAILFDLDGTLWEVIEQSWLSANEVVQQYPFLKEISKEQIRNGMGLQEKECAYLYMHYLKEEQSIELFRIMCDINNQRILEYGGNVYPHLEEVLKQLHQEYFLGIVSNCSAGYIESFLQSSNLQKYFTDFIAAGKENISKGEAIKRIIERNHIDRAIYMGDTINDLKASLEANISFIHAKYGFGKNIDTRYSIHDIQELPDLIKQNPDIL